MTEPAPSGGLLAGMCPAASAQGFRLGNVPSLCGGVVSSALDVPLCENFGGGGRRPGLFLHSFRLGV